MEGSWFTEFLASLLGSGAGIAAVALLGRDWLAARLKAAVEEGVRRKQIAYDLKREACLEALDVVDAARSQMDWRDSNDKPIPVQKQPVSIVAARRSYNRLALTCTNPRIIELYARLLGLRTPEESGGQDSGDSIVDLRNEMRRELSLGSELPFDRERAWIASIRGADS